MRAYTLIPVHARRSMSNDASPSCVCIMQRCSTFVYKYYRGFHREFGRLTQIFFVRFFFKIDVRARAAAHQARVHA